MDTPAAGDVEVIPLRYAVAADIAAAGAAPDRQRRPARRRRARRARRRRQRAAPSILVDTRSNSLIVRSANPARMASVRVADRQARPAAAGGGRRPATSGSCYLKNADATKLAQVLRAAFSSRSRRRRRRRRQRLDAADGAAAAPTPAGAAGTASGRQLGRGGRADHRLGAARRPAASSRPTRRPTR